MAMARCLFLAVAFAMLFLPMEGFAMRCLDDASMTEHFNIVVEGKISDLRNGPIGCGGTGAGASPDYKEAIVVVTKTVKGTVPKLLSIGYQPSSYTMLKKGNRLRLYLNQTTNGATSIESPCQIRVLHGKGKV